MIKGRDKSKLIQIGNCYFPHPPKFGYHWINIPFCGSFSSSLTLACRQCCGYSIEGFRIYPCLTECSQPSKQLFPLHNHHLNFPHIHLQFHNTFAHTASQLSQKESTEDCRNQNNFHMVISENYLQGSRSAAQESLGEITHHGPESDVQLWLLTGLC